MMLQHVAIAVLIVAMTGCQSPTREQEAQQSEPSWVSFWQNDKPLEKDAHGAFLLAPGPFELRFETEPRSFFTVRVEYLDEVDWRIDDGATMLKINGSGSAWDRRRLPVAEPVDRDADVYTVADVLEMMGSPKAEQELIIAALKEDDLGDALVVGFSDFPFSSNARVQTLDGLGENVKSPARLNLVIFDHRELKVTDLFNEVKVQTYELTLTND